jgi:hypothetical protein
MPDFSLSERVLPSGKIQRYFSDDKLQKAIDDALQHVDPDTPIAVVAHGSYEGGQGTAHLSAAARLDDKFTIVVAAYKEWGGPSSDVGAGAKVVWTP